MASAALASKYEKLVIDKNGKRVRLDGKTTSFSYYESIYSPFVTATLIFIDTGGSVTAERDQDTQSRLGNIVSSLPITGRENIEVKISSKYGTLSFLKNPLKVNNPLIPSQDSNRTGVLLDLISSAGLENQEKLILKKYKGRISDTVFKILNEELNIPKDRINIDETSNAEGSTTNGKTPLDFILRLCKKSIPVDGDPGYFFYETQDGFNFKSIDTLIKQDVKQVYTFTPTLGGEENDFKILLPPKFLRDQDVLTALKSGTYFSRNVFFDPRTFQYDEIIFNLSENGVKRTLGKIPPHLNEIKSYTRTHFHILDVGSQDPNISININNDPRQWQAKSSMRYNLLHSQVLEIQVPCNLNLRAGDVIQCNIAKTTKDKNELGVYDMFQSGRYLIANLCHYFDAKRSYTSLTLLRDTYGLYTNKK